ncbi:MAG: hypothetical protein JW889_07720 [Verrucomicrobia bacterium]|nr:hypothetical protein [Verrucomicrobiota bacterium]
MKRKLVNVLTAAPVIVGAMLTVVFCVITFLDGLRLVRGLHVFRWFGLLYAGRIPFCTAVLVWAVGAVVGRNDLHREHRIVHTLNLLWAGLLLSVVALVLMAMTFFAGRSLAYRGLDDAKIHAACLECAKNLEGEELPAFIQSYDDRFDSLPDAIRSLKPMSVEVTQYAVTVWIDGGGVAPHEGVAVPLVEVDGKQLSRVGGIRRLDRSLPVYFFRLGDARDFSRAVEDTVEAGSDAPVLTPPSARGQTESTGSTA